MSITYLRKSIDNIIRHKIDTLSSTLTAYRLVSALPEAGTNWPFPSWWTSSLPLGCWRDFPLVSSVATWRDSLLGWRPLDLWTGWRRRLSLIGLASGRGASCRHEPRGDSPSLRCSKRLSEEKSSLLFEFLHRRLSWDSPEGSKLEGKDTCEL